MTSVNTESTERPLDSKPAAPDTGRISLVLVSVAGVALIATCLLSSPRAFSAQHQNESSLLRIVVSLLSLSAPSATEPAFPTVRGIEIRNLIFYVGAAILTLCAGLWLVSSGRKHRMSSDDLFDLRERASGPYFWWVLLLLVSVVTSVFSHAPDVSKGQVVIRFMHFAWWCPLAALLASRHARTLMTALVVGIAAMAAVGIWHYSIRLAPGWLSSPFSSTLPRLSYPIGNETWLGACLLPALFMGLGLGLQRRSKSSGRAGSSSPAFRRWLSLTVVFVALLLVLVALGLTRARSAGFGLAAGVFAFVVFSLSSRKKRLVVVFIGLLAAIAGAKWVQHLRTTGVMGQRAHSIRSRLDYEWPYALQMFGQKPVGGYGEGGYAMLAGQIARSDQLEDPSVIAVEERWPAHAHNEWLQLLADVGLAGMLGLLMAVVLTLYWAMRYCDASKEGQTGAGDRWLAISMSAALVGMAVEEGSNMALREPGFPPIFLTVWAALWALVGRSRRVSHSAEEGAPADARVMRVAGVVVAVGGLVLAYFAIQDWRSARSRFDGLERIPSNERAVQAVDFAAAHTLDPMQKLLARLDAIHLRVVGLEQSARGSDVPPTDAELATAQDALIKLNRLNQAAPRFLQVPQMAYRLTTFLADAHLRLRDLQVAQGYDEQRLLALRQYRADEPFNIHIVERLWRDERLAAARRRLWQRSGEVSAMARHLRDRLQWLQCLLRRREVDDPFVALFLHFRQIPGAKGLMDGLVDVAGRDSEREPSKWEDPLSPETLRIEALAKSLESKPREAAALAEQAATMYEKAGPRLFVAHAAAIREAVLYRFYSDPLSNTDAMLGELARANEILTGVKDKEGARPLTGSLGQLRLWILLAAGRPEADAQMQALFSAEEAPASELLGRAHAKLAEKFTFSLEHGELAVQWARRAVEISPDLTEAHMVLMGSLLQQNEDAEAMVPAHRIIELAPDQETAFAMLRLVEARWPNRGVWAEIRRKYPDFPPRKQGDSPAVTTQPTDGGVIEGGSAPTVGGQSSEP